MEVRDKMPPTILRKIAGAATFLLSLLWALSARASELDLPVPQAMHDQKLLYGGLVVCAFGLIFGLVIFLQLKRLPVHRSMLEISDLIYETCKTYLITQGKFMLLLWGMITVIMVGYFGILQGKPALTVI